MTTRVRTPGTEPGRRVARQTRTAPGAPGQARRSQPAPSPVQKAAPAAPAAAARAPGQNVPTPRATAPKTPGGGQRATPRTPFVLLVIGLLGGGLACLLVVNTTLAAGSLQITRLQQENAATSQRIAQVQQQVAREQSPASIQQRAQQLGLRPQPVLNFVDVRNGRRYTTAAPLPSDYPVPPGYTP